MLEVRFYDSVADELLAYAVIIARTQDKWVFCKHRDRDTYEVPELSFDTAASDR